MNEKITFEKSYTRDASAIVEQAWNHALMNAFKDLFGFENKYLPPVIHYINDGVCEIWENPKSTQWLMDILLDKNKSDSNFLRDQLEEYKVDLGEIGKFWKKGKITVMSEFKEFIDLVFDSMLKFIIMYYSAVDERAPTELREMALKMRAEDIFFDENHKVTGDSLVGFYPELAGFENMILRNEIENPPAIEILRERKKHFVFIAEKFGKAISIEEYVKNNPDYHLKIEKPTDEDRKLLKGATGFGGKVEGRVRVMKRKEQMEEIVDGEILVSPMTTPDFLPAMKKAAAFVTDEGGITCHAAIVAREMKKPCVIGTKFSTEVLKDGDFVEVDANHGVVRILEKGK